MATNAALKALNATNIRNKTAAGSVTRKAIADGLDAALDYADQQAGGGFSTVPFTQVIDFKKPKQFSEVAQADNLVFTLDPASAVKPAEYVVAIRTNPSYTIALDETVFLRVGAYNQNADCELHFFYTGLMPVCRIVNLPKTAQGNTLYTGSYTTTTTDYTNRCGAGTTGAAVTKSGSSTSSQAEADNMARQAALSAIVCPVSAPLTSLEYPTAKNTDSVVVVDSPDFAFSASQPWTIILFGLEHLVADAEFFAGTTSKSTGQQVYTIQVYPNSGGSPGQCSMVLQQSPGNYIYIEGYDLADLLNKPYDISFSHDGMGSFSITIGGTTRGVLFSAQGNVTSLPTDQVFKIGQSGSSLTHGERIQGIGIYNKLLSLDEIDDARAKRENLPATTAYANLIDAYRFEHNTNSLRGTHNGTAAAAHYYPA